MKIGTKLFTLFTVSYLLIFIVLQIFANSFLLGGMEELENNRVIQDTSMSVSALMDVINDVDEAATRFSSYNSIFRYIKSPELVSEEYVWSVLNDAALSETRVNYVFIFNDNGEVLLEKGYDPSENRGTPVPEELGTFFEMNSILVVHQSPTSKLAGLLRTPVGLFIISSQPISTGVDTISGSLIMCRSVDMYLTEELGDALLVSPTLIELNEQKSIEYQRILNEVSTETPIVVETSDYDVIKGYTVMNDLYGLPTLLIETDSPRDVYHMGVTMINYFVISFVLIGVSIGMLALLALNRLVMMPLTKLSREVAEINPETIRDNSLEIPGDDEISGLSKDIDRMLKALREYQSRIKENERMVSIGATATMVGHDLRNPLQVVVMLSDLIQKKLRKIRDVPDEQIAEVEKLTVRIKDQATYMNKIVSDLQGLTKGLSLEITDVDVIELVEEVIETVQIPENITPKIMFEEDFPEIYADSAKLRRVFTNLVTNAVQAMPHGGELVVKSHRSVDKVIVSVIDTGCGISEENMNRIFDPLFTTKAKGTGLGLTVCKRIIEAHGGEIKTMSTHGIGTRFTVMLPINNTPEGLQRIVDAAQVYDAPENHILPSCL